MKAYRRRRRTVKEVRRHGLFHIAAQILPSFGLGKNTFSQAFGHEATVGILRNLKNQFIHKTISIGYAVYPPPRVVSNAEFVDVL